ncbi:unnamed protein product, partial [marine sediment metagenome]
EFPSRCASEPEKGILAGKQFASKREAYEFYREWVLTDLHKLHWSIGHISQAQRSRVYKYGVDRDIPPEKYALGHDIGVPSTIPYLEQRGIDPGETFFGAGGVVAGSAAYLFSLGLKFKFFWWECSYVGTGLQPGIAMVRGAARQYGRKWLMDHSPYSSRMGGSAFSGPFARGLEKLNSWGMTREKAADGTERLEWHITHPQFDEDGNRLSGLSTDMIRRDWLWGYMSGADAIFQEAAATTHFTKVGTSADAELRLTPYG